VKGQGAKGKGQKARGKGKGQRQGGRGKEQLAKARRKRQGIKGKKQLVKGKEQCARGKMCFLFIEDVVVFDNIIYRISTFIDQKSTFKYHISYLVYQIS